MNLYFLQNRGDRTRSLRRALLFPLTVLVLLGFLASGSLYLFSSRAAVRDVVGRLAIETTANIKSRLTRLLDIPRSVGTTFSDFVFIRNDAGYRSSLLQRALHAQIERLPELSIVAIGFADGEYIDAKRFYDGTIVMSKAGASTEGTLETWTCDENGAFLQRIQTYDGYDPRNRPWYIRAARERQPCWSEIYPYYSDLNLAIAASVPVLVDGTVEAVVSASMTLDGIGAFLDSIPQASTGMLAIVDRHGSLVAASGGLRPILLPDGSLASVSIFSNPILAETVGLFADKTGDRIEPIRFAINGKRYIAGATTLPDYECDLGWKIIAALPESEYLQRLTKSDISSSLVFLALLTLALSIAWFMTGKLTEPLRMLKKAVGDLAIGRFTGDPADTVRSLASRRDEIGALAASFEDMRARLYESFSSLKANLAEKEILLKEVHHRVKNNLQVISSILSIQAGEIKDPSALAGFSACQDRIQAMAFVHEGVYQSGMFSEVDMGDYLRKICDSLRWTRGEGRSEAEFLVNAEDVHITLAQAIPCGLIVNELVVNALKYAFPDGRPGKIFVSMVRVAAEWSLVVEDDGIGCTSRSPSVGIGRKLVDSLVLQLCGRIEYDPGGEGRGVRVEIRFEA